VLVLLSASSHCTSAARSRQGQPLSRTEHRQRRHLHKQHRHSDIGFTNDPFHGVQTRATSTHRPDQRGTVISRPVGKSSVRLPALSDHYDCRRHRHGRTDRSVPFRRQSRRHCRLGDAHRGRESDVRHERLSRQRRRAGPIVLTAGGNITLMRLHCEGFGAGNGVAATAAATSRSKQHEPGGDDSFRQCGGNISLTTGPTGTFTLFSGTNGQVNSGVATWATATSSLALPPWSSTTRSRRQQQRRHRHTPASEHYDTQYRRGRRHHAGDLNISDTALAKLRPVPCASAGPTTPATSPSRTTAAAAASRPAGFSTLDLLSAAPSPRRLTLPTSR